MDTYNPVVKLCAEGMQAEIQGCADDARRLFEQAWDAHKLQQVRDTDTLSLSKKRKPEASREEAKEPSRVKLIRA